MTPAVDRGTDALQGFGYTAREAAFLRLAALHSGYFLRRQYLQFIGSTRGRPDDVLVSKTAALRHTKPVTSLTTCHDLSPLLAALLRGPDRER